MKFLLKIAQKSKTESLYYHYIYLVYDKTTDAAHTIDEITKHTAEDDDIEFTMTTIREDESNDDI